MGGLINTVVRKSDNTDISFKLNTNYWARRFVNPDIFDERNFKKELKKLKNMSAPKNLEQHNTYQNGASLKAPFDYGLLFIDYLEKEIHSINKFTPFSMMSSYFLNKEYNDLKENLILSKNKKEFILEAGDYLSYPSIFRFNQFLKYSPHFIFNDNTLYTSKLTPFEILNYISKYGYQVEKKRTVNVPLKFFSDVEIQIPEWEIFEYAPEKNEFEQVFEIFLSKLNLSDDEILAWEDYFKNIK